MREDYNNCYSHVREKGPPVRDLGIFFGPGEGSLLPYLQRAYPGTKRAARLCMGPSGSGLGFQVAVNNTEAGERKR